MKRLLTLAFSVALLPTTVAPAAAQAQVPQGVTPPVVDANGHSRRAMTLFDQGRYSEAAQEQKRAIDLCRRDPSLQRQPLLGLIVNLATMYAEAGDFSAAEKEARYVLELLKGRVRDESGSEAAAHNVLARVAVASGDFEQAEAHLSEELAIKERHPSDTMALANALNDLAMVKTAQGDLRAGRSLFERSLAIYRSAVPIHTLPYGRILVNLGLLCARQGDFVAATLLFQEGIALLEQQLGPKDPEVCSTLSQQAKLFRKTGRKREAREIEKRVREAMAEAPERFLEPGTVDIRALKR
jgi:tetratricopeptide (TPR) repeat protein